VYPDNNSAFIVGSRATFSTVAAITSSSESSFFRHTFFFGENDRPNPDTFVQHRSLVNTWNAGTPEKIALNKD
jgi:hypothetical protein